MDATQRQFCRSLKRLMAMYPTAEAAREAKRKAGREEGTDHQRAGREAALKGA